MSSANSQQSPACFVGVRAIDNIMEIHAVNANREVVLKGWFSREVGLALIGNRPASVIAIESDTVPDDVLSELEGLGHSTVLVPSLQGTPRTSARAICSLGLTLSHRVH